jgi:hypothetical protein
MDDTKLDNKIAFIYAAIGDCQSTIRAIDVKLGALLAGIFIPIASLDKIWLIMEGFSSKVGSFSSLIISLFFILWLVIAFVLVKTIAAIDNPKDHVSDSSLYSGCFYNGGQFQFGVLDSFFNRKSIQSKNSVAVISTRYPGESCIVNELSFDHLKLAYIRDIKLHRLRFGILATFCWALVGLTIYSITKF